MASTLLSPGVAIQERDLTLGSIETVETNVGAIAGAFEKGPILTPTRISNEAELLEIFGKPNDSNYEYWWSAAGFLSYGGVLDVVRADAGNLTASNDGVTNPYTLKINNDDDFLANYNAGTAAFNFAARTPGAFGNSLDVAVIDGGADQILTLSGVLTTNAVGTVINDVAGTKSARIVAYDASNTSAVLVTISGDNFTTADSVDNGSDDRTVDAAVSWYDQQFVFTGLKWNSIAPRPGTSP